MNQGVLELIKTQCQDLQGNIGKVLDCIEDIEAREALYKKEKEITQQKENAIRQREVKLENERLAVEADKQDIVNKIQENQKERETLTKEKDKLDIYRREIAAEKQAVEEKILQLQELDVRKQHLDKREEELVKRGSDLVEKENMIQKELIIDRNRKERLDIAEKEIEREKEKIKKYLNI